MHFHGNKQKYTWAFNTTDVEGSVKKSFTNIFFLKEYS